VFEGLCGHDHLEIGHLDDLPKPVMKVSSSVLDLKFARLWVDLYANFKSNKHTSNQTFLVWP
jgi:hypothetical protein